ncbi:MAG: hypothetical protein ACI8ZN_002118 [Bacteroidia bacterium]
MSAFGQGTINVPSLQSCYQFVTFDNQNKTKNILNSGFYKFVQASSETENPEYWWIRQYDEGGLPISFDYYEMGLAQYGGPFHPRYFSELDDYVATGKKYVNGEFVFNDNTFHFDEDAKTVIIIPYEYKEPEFD